MRTSNVTRSRQILGLGIVLLLVVAIVWALFTLNPNVTAAIVAAAVTAFVSIYQLNASRRHQTEALIEKDLREKKVAVYERLIAFIIDMMFAERMGKKQSSKDILREYGALAPSMTIWTSDAVLREFARFRSGLVQQKDTPNPAQAIKLIEDLILAIRHDLGHQNVGLSAGDILSVFITDAYKVLDEVGANSTVPADAAKGPPRG